MHLWHLITIIQHFLMISLCRFLLTTVKIRYNSTSNMNSTSTGINANGSLFPTQGAYVFIFDLKPKRHRLCAAHQGYYILLV